MPPLALCRSCSRHVRPNEVACPFCGAPPPFAAGRAPTGASRLTRVAAFSLGATLAAAGCGHDALPGESTDAAADRAVPDEGALDARAFDAANPDASDGGASDGAVDLANRDLPPPADMSWIPIYSAPPPRDAE